MITKCKEVDAGTASALNRNLLAESFFFDIETSGLSYKYSTVVSISVLLFENGSLFMHQLFCEYRIDEKEMIYNFKELIKGKKYIISYNGNGFDIPFMSSRAAKYGIDLGLDRMVKIDLYNDMRRFRNKIEIPDLKLKTVEKHFGIDRKDALLGQDVTILYEAYCIEPRKEFAELILEHNFEDVLSLPVLFGKIMDTYDAVFGYKDITIKMNYSDLLFRKNSLIGSFYVISGLSTDYIYPAQNFDLKLDTASQLLEVKVPVSTYSDNMIEEFRYLRNDDFKIPSYTCIEGIKKNLIPLKFNGKLFNDDIRSIIKLILDDVF
jgi:uncharacterized protein YprB with RNaseH-like and TPR domain